jgi:hypothetical protein
MGEFFGQKGAENAVDHLCHSLNFVAAGIAQWLHDGWGHSYPSGHRHYRISGPTYSGSETILAIRTLAEERRLG